MRLVKRIDRAIVFTCYCLLVTLMGIITVSAFIQVYARFILNDPPSWTDELCRFGMVWISMIGAGYAVRSRKHISVDLIKEVLSPAGVKFLDILASILTIMISFTLVYFGIFLVALNLPQQAPGLQISMGLIYCAIPIGGCLMLFYALLGLIGFTPDKKQAE